MANVIGELVYKITGDASQLNSSLTKTDAATKTASKGFLSLDKVVKATIIGALVGAALKLKDFGEKLINIGSDAEEVSNKFNAVFSSIRGDATTAVNELAKAYNLSATEAQKLVGNTADILTGLGLTQTAALDLSLSVNALSADLASFNNIPVEQASNAITKALLGEREAIKTLGIAIGEEDVKQRLLAEGKENLTGLSLRQAKAEITLKLALEQSKNAIGDVARSSDSLANKRKELAAVEDDYFSLLGGYLQGPAKAFTQWQIDATRGNIALVTSFAQWIDQVRQSESVQYTFAAISIALQSIKDSAEKSKVAFAEFLTSLKDKAITTVQTGLDLLSEKFDGLGISISDSLTPLSVYTFAASGLGNVMKLLGQILGGVLNIFVDLGTALAKSGKAFIAFNRALSGRGSFEDFKDSVKDIGGAFVDLKDNAVNRLNDIGDGFSSFTDRTKSDAKKYADSLNGIVEKNKKVTSTTTTTANAIDEVTEATEKNTTATKDNRTEWEKMVESMGAYKAALQIISQAASATFSGISDYISAVGALQQAQYDAQIARLDQQLQAELEAAGLSEETTIEKYERELAEAQESGDAIAIEEARKNLERAKIEDKYQKKKTELEYKAALANWEIQKSLAMIQMFQAPLNAYTSALAIPLVGNFIAPALAALALSAAAKNYQAVTTSKPQPPKFENGGIIPGSAYSGDNVEILGNSGEVVLNDNQQAQLLDIANGGGSNNNLTPVIVNDAATLQWLFDRSKNGEFLFFKGSVVD